MLIVCTHRKHKNVVGLHGVCTSEEGDPLVVMSFAAKNTLVHFLEFSSCDQIDSEERFQILEGIAQGLRMIHACDILHLDIKPANVLIAEDGTPWLTDFGTSESLSTTTRKGGAGTCQYMSPERFDDYEAPTKAADVFSLGVLMWEVLVGETPWAGKDRAKIMKSVCMKEGRPSLASGADWRESPHVVATGMGGLIELMWAQEHEDRPTIETASDAPPPPPFFRLHTRRFFVRLNELITLDL